jgi:hypothetical protein
MADRYWRYSDLRESLKYLMQREYGDQLGVFSIVEDEVRVQIMEKLVEA